MIGVLFTLLEDAAKERFGSKVWYDALREATGTFETVYVAHETYADEEFERLIHALSQRTSLAQEELLRAFGLYAFPRLAHRHPGIVDACRSLKEFLRSLHVTMRQEMQCFYPTERTPSLSYEEVDGGVAFTVASPCGLCSLLEGLLEGAAAWFGESLQLRQSRCARRGDPGCRFELVFGRDAVPLARYG
ncbi:MAG: heme NO-binding domain-containing protein [Planctomycetes bacterium]|nr:heme NO-binding domain-containing protein [Planctomycetota bacterium]